MILQLLILLFITVDLSSKIACKRFSPLKRNHVEAEQQANSGRFVCPIGSAVKGIDFEKKKVYCENHDKTISDERSPKLCEWRKRCSFISKNRKASRNNKLKPLVGQDDFSRIARGFRFGVGKAKNIAQTSELFCCLTDCTTNRCKVFKFSNERGFVGPKQNQNWFLNYIDWKPRLKRIYTGYCRAKCNPARKATDCKTEYTNLRDFKNASHPDSGRFVCPIGTAVRAVDLKCRNVYCIDYKERKPKRSQKNCSWKKKCNTIKDSIRTSQQNTNKVKIARALRFHRYRKGDAIKDMQLFCCTETCSNFTCKYEEGEGSILDTDPESEAFLNFGTQRTRRQTKRGQYCESSCAAITPPGWTGILTISPPCLENFKRCARDNECCSGICNPQYLFCDKCYEQASFCNRDIECCTKSCVGDFCK